MLCVNQYPREYVDECRSRMAAQLNAYRELAAPGGATVEAFEPQFFNHLVLALDRYFVHRSRTLEGKNGNPLNEVRMLCSSLLEHHGVLAADKTIKYRPENAVLQLQIGDEIRLLEADFEALCSAFFRELEATFVAPAPG